MKLIFCRKCWDVFKAGPRKVKTCNCGACQARYNDNLYAEYYGTPVNPEEPLTQENCNAVPLGFANGSLMHAIQNQPQRDWGKTFNAFVIEKECPTYTWQTEPLQPIDTDHVVYNKDHMERKKLLEDTEGVSDVRIDE